LGFDASQAVTEMDYRANAGTAKRKKNNRNQRSLARQSRKKWSVERIIAFWFNKKQKSKGLGRKKME